MTTFLYAFNPQLKSCKFFIPENLRAVALNNFVGIVLDNGSYLFFFPAGYQIVPVFGDHPVKFGYLIRAVLQIGVHGNDHVTFSPLESAMQSRRLTVVATELDSPGRVENVASTPRSLPKNYPYCRHSRKILHRYNYVLSSPALSTRITRVKTRLRYTTG